MNAEPDRQVVTQAERHDCPNCNATAKAIAIVIARWVVAGMDKGE